VAGPILRPDCCSGNGQIGVELEDGVIRLIEIEPRVRIVEGVVDRRSGPDPVAVHADRQIRELLSGLLLRPALLPGHGAPFRVSGRGAASEDAEKIRAHVVTLPLA
jgi:hypothetical protein